MRKLTACALCVLLLAGCSGSTSTENTTTALPVTGKPAVSTTTAAMTTPATTTTTPAATTASTPRVTSIDIVTTAATTAVTTEATTEAITTLPTVAATTTAVVASSAATAATSSETTIGTPLVSTSATTTAVPQTPDEGEREQYIVIDDSWIEVCAPFDETSVVRFADKIESVRKLYPKMEPVLALIPDKTVYANEELGELALDHDRMTTLVSENLDGIPMVELSDLYTWESFYKTDLHWRQEILPDTAKRIGDALGITVDVSAFTETNLGAFHGIYADLYMGEEEPLIVLDHPDFKDVTVSHYEKTDCTTVYDTVRADSDNSYDAFLSGASPLTVIKNPNAEAGTNLLVFRDSFGSSLVPLLIPSYETITMVDLRYMHSSLLRQFVSVTEGDLLFLYSARIVNNSLLLR